MYSTIDSDQAIIYDTINGVTLTDERRLDINSKYVNLMQTYRGANLFDIYADNEHYNNRISRVLNHKLLLNYISSSELDIVQIKATFSYNIDLEHKAIHPHIIALCYSYDTFTNPIKPYGVVREVLDSNQLFDKMQLIGMPNIFIDDPYYALEIYFNDSNHNLERIMFYLYSKVAHDISRQLELLMYEDICYAD